MRVTVGAGGGGAPFTVTVAFRTGLLPPAPMHCRLYVTLAVRFVNVWLLEVALAPVQPPEAVHEVALVLDHVSVELPPEETEVGFAASVSVGAGGVAWTFTVAERWIEPPVPVHWSV